MRAIIAQLLSKNSSDFDFEFSKLEGYLLQYNNNLRIISEVAFPAEVIASIRIPRIYKEAVENPKYAQQ